MALFRCGSGASFDMLTPNHAYFTDTDGNASATIDMSTPYAMTGAGGFAGTLIINVEGISTLSMASNNIPKDVIGIKADGSIELAHYSTGTTATADVSDYKYAIVNACGTINWNCSVTTA